MDNRAEVREFLTTRRARLTPEAVGLPSHGRRRVTGLRRNEVAVLAGVSVEYYAKMERGTLAGVSSGVLNAVADALRLDEAERAHLLRLALAADGSTRVLRRPSSPTSWNARATLQFALDAITGAPAAVGNDRLDLLATNLLGRALFADMFLDPRRPPNFARYTFLDSSARRFYPAWEQAADVTVANLRTAAGKHPDDRALHELVRELTAASPEFARRWEAHDVRIHGSGTKRYRHHVVGDLELSYETLDLRAEPGLAMTIYAAVPASPTAEALALLASWASSELAEAELQSSAVELGARPETS